jgi:hypothetical protein
MLARLGLDQAKLTYRYLGCDFRLIDVAANPAWLPRLRV